MEIDIEKLIKTVTESLNLQDFKGDVVAVKMVENEIGNVAPGGIGVYKGGGMEKAAPEVSPLIKELLPIFMNVRTEVVDFLQGIDGQKPTAVTELVNEFVKAGKITKAGRKGDLWDILHRYGLYKAGKETWNKQVN